MLKYFYPPRPAVKHGGVFNFVHFVHLFIVHLPLLREGFSALEEVVEVDGVVVVAGIEAVASSSFSGEA